MSNLKCAAYTAVGALSGLCLSAAFNTPEYLYNTPPLEINEETARYTFNAISSVAGAGVGLMAYTLRQLRKYEMI